VNHDLWILDKVNTYYLQTEPFIHIDADFIFIKDVDNEFLKSSVSFQSLDDFTTKECWFYPNRIDKLIQKNIISYSIVNYAFNFGVYVCNDLNINKKYCKEVFKLSEKILNKKINPLVYNTIVEQYTMSKILKDNNITPLLLLRDYSEECAEKIGFIHILTCKNNKEYFKKIKGLYEAI